MSDVALDTETIIDADDLSPGIDPPDDASIAAVDLSETEEFRINASSDDPAPPVAAVPASASIVETFPPEPLSITAFAAAVGLAPDQFKSSGTDTVERAGLLLRHLITGLVTLVEARARAKSEMGAERTALSFDGNNPIKFAGNPSKRWPSCSIPRSATS